MSFMLPVPTTEELKSYEVLAKIVASNPHWRQVGGETKDKKLSDEEITSTIFCVMLLAREIGIPPMQAVSYGINNIKGKFELSARGMNQLIRQRGHSLKVTVLNHDICKIWGKRRDTGEEMEATYHIEEARRAGLVKEYGGWAKNPQDMVFARAISRLGRRLFADCIGGFYIEGELQESIEKKVVDSPEMPDIEIVSQEPMKNIRERLAFEIPADIADSSIESYLSESAETCGVTIEALISGANKRPSSFLNALRLWEDKKTETPELVMSGSVFDDANIDPVEMHV